MMPNCSVIGCEFKKTQNQPNFTLHRLPRCKDKKKKWLAAIGMENIKQGVKDIFICSQHFDEDAFNRTLAVVRLQDDAIPLVNPLQQDNLPTMEFENTEDSAYILVKHDSSVVALGAAEPDPGVFVQDSLELPIQNKRVRRIKRLEHICLEQRKKMKRLNEVIRRQNKKIADFRNIIKDLLESNLLDLDNSISSGLNAQHKIMT